ncbi:General stress protein A [Streptococcus infantarius subsp. infantarius]|uniref:glycosyltransferase family 8 protein n=1 Tax=uncultured Streptococcus sp. TaxID=83427 RepID=UPI00208FC509|nr:glycosyltransferase family 8 protein [uncultured Streptococcus sp.]MCO4528717.1 General stress protein A [Streptococcus infantarius subsp. infantarius]
MVKKDNVIVYASDSNYVPHMAASMLSVMETNINESFSFLVLDNNIGKENQMKILNLCMKYNREISFFNINEYLNKIALNTSFNKTAFARLFIDDIVKKDKALYLDCDTIVCDSLKPLFNLELGDNMIAGVQDTVSLELRTVVGLKGDEEYINTGVLLLNLSLWRKNNIREKFFKCIEEFNGNVPHNDQGVINSICHNNVCILPARYNMQDTMIFYTVEELKELFQMPSYYNSIHFNEDKKNPSIIHYTEAHYGRPWYGDSNHPYKQLYVVYRMKLKDFWDYENVKAPEIKRIKRKLKQFLYALLPFSIYKKLMFYRRKKGE